MANASAVNQEAPERSILKVALTALAGSSIEWYDFFIYGTAAALVFGQLFFPDFSPLAGTLAAFGTYAVGFFIRPFGGLVFGHFGDKLGRKPVLVMTLLLMGIATTLIGLLPTYDTIGVWAPILLVALRVLQGLGAGAEYGGAILMSGEHATGRRGFYASWPASGVYVGILLSSGIFALVSTLPEVQLLAWGWRVPFLLSIIVVGVGLFIRLRILETPEFTEQVKETGNEARVPALTVIRNSPKNVLVAMGANVALNGYSYILQVFVLTYVTAQLGLSNSTALTGVLIAAAIGVFTVPAFGALSDRIGRRPVIMGGAVFSVLFAFPFWWLVDTKVSVLIWLAIVLGLCLGMNPMFGPQAAFYTELFDTPVRYSGIVLARETTGALIGGPTPFIATALLAWAGGDPWPVAAYMVVMALIPLVSIYLAPETLQSYAQQERTQEPRTVVN
jgi:MFS transporter, MHS family, shikimate and dehydroshikimate transport protein